jgi:hypothetical protein
MPSTKRVYSNEEILQAQRQDPVAIAEAVLGSASADSGLMALQLQAKKSEALRVMLKSRNDTTFLTKTEEHRQILLANGFELVYQENFIDDQYVNSPKNPQPAREQQYFIYYRHPGLLLSFDTYGENVNGGRLYYNWKAHSETVRIPHNVLESGGTSKEGIHVGYRDCREGLIMAIQRMEEYGSFLETWKEGQFLWLLNYMESKVEGYDHDYISLKKLRALPERVRKLFLPAQENYYRANPRQSDAFKRLLVEPLPQEQPVRTPPTRGSWVRRTNYRVAFKKQHSRGLRMGYLKPRDLELRKAVEGKRRAKLLFAFLDRKKK